MYWGVKQGGCYLGNLFDQQLALAKGAISNVAKVEKLGKNQIC